SLYDVLPFSNRFQPTRPRGARPRPRRADPPLLRVSTHAPAWGATYDLPWDIVPEEVSTHAPAWGATREITHFVRLTDVSTHAPAWGATKPPSRTSESQNCFNPRARVGRDCRAAICAVP